MVSFKGISRFIPDTRTGHCLPSTSKLSISAGCQEQKCSRSCTEHLTSSQAAKPKRAAPVAGFLWVAFLTFQKVLIVGITLFNCASSPAELANHQKQAELEPSLVGNPRAEPLLRPASCSGVGRRDQGSGRSRVSRPASSEFLSHRCQNYFRCSILRSRDPSFQKTVNIQESLAVSQKNDA